MPASDAPPSPCTSAEDLKVPDFEDALRQEVNCNQTHGNDSATPPLLAVGSGETSEDSRAAVSSTCDQSCDPWAKKREEDQAGAQALDLSERGPESEVVSDQGTVRQGAAIQHRALEEEKEADSADAQNEERKDHDENDIPEEVKREMLANVCKGVVVLTRESRAPGGHCKVYLVGTAHVSEESCGEVRNAIRLVKPQVVFVELCEKRRFMLGSAHLQVPTVKEMLNTWREKRMNTMGILYSWFLAKVAAKMEVFPGQEFRVAYEEARACGAKVLLGDRDVQVTLKRTWNKMSLWHKTKFIFCTVFQAIYLPSMEDLKQMIQELKDNDVLTLAFQELSKSFPTLMETLVHERDMYMTAVLQKVAEHHSSIVAVVGKGHIPGITKNWDTNISVNELDKIPTKRLNAWKFYIWGAAAIGLPVSLSWFLLQSRH